MRFDGVAIFGTQTRQSGPIPKTRNQRESLPGVRGYRSYQLTGEGADTLVWSVRGRLVARTLQALEEVITDAQAMLGRFAVFESTGGIKYRNCELIDYRPASPFMKAILFDGTLCFTCEVSATIERASA